MTNFEDQFNRAKQAVSLDPHRKAEIRIQLARHIIENPVKNSAYASGNFWAVFAFQFRRPAMISALVIFVVLAGAGTAYASEGALPGDALYPVKLNVTEKVKGAFATTPKAQAEFELALLDKRLDESLQLAAQGKLDGPTETEVTTLITEHENRVKNSLAKLEKTDDDSAIDLQTKLEASTRIHDQVLNQFKGGKKIKEDLKARLQQNNEDSTNSQNKNKESFNNKSAAEGKINAAGQVIAEVGKYIESKSGDAQGTAVAKAKLADAANLLVQARSEVSAGDYAKAFVSANTAIRVAQESKSLIRISRDLNVKVESTSDDSSDNDTSKSGSNNSSNFQDRFRNLDDRLHSGF